MSKKRAIRRGDRRGAAVIEFALVAPLFLLLLAGIIEFGQVFRIEHMLSNASRRGARSAIVDGATSSQVKQMIRTHCMQILRVDESDITVEIAVNGTVGADLSQAVEQDEISISVSIPYSEAGVGFYANTFSNATLSSTCILEHE